MSNQTPKVVFSVGHSNETTFHSELKAMLKQGYRFAYTVTHKYPGGQVRQVEVYFHKLGR